MPAPLEFFSPDLAPGDTKAAALDLAPLQFNRIRACEDPLFETAYSLLWAEFGAKNELERRETLARRFADGSGICYEMILVRRGAEPFGVRDHSAILTRDRQRAVVHLSHNLILPSARRSGLAGWMRALPIQTARELLVAAGVSTQAPVTLVAEMEYTDEPDQDRIIRLRAYEKAGFLKIDPQVVDYYQPDFRSPAAIDADGGARPVRFQLVIRRVAREREQSITGGEIHELVAALYDIYRPQFRPEDLAHPLLDLARLPAAEEKVELLPPTQC